MLNYSAIALPLERIRGEQCSESLSEEQYVLHRYFGGSTGTPKRGGVFFELGAFDGWQESNTVHLENCLAWTGVLVDAPTHLDSVVHQPAKRAKCRPRGVPAPWPRQLLDAKIDDCRHF